MMKVGNQWLPAFLNSINGTPTYTYMNDQGQWADASGNTYSVEHPLDEVTVKYDPATGGQINRAAPDYWRQYGQRRMQQTAGNVDKVIMGIVGGTALVFGAPYIQHAFGQIGPMAKYLYGGLRQVPSNLRTLWNMYGKDVKRIGLEYATGQGLERIGDFAMKHALGMDADETSHKLLSPIIEPLDISDSKKEGLYRFGSQYVNPGNWYNPAKHLINGYLIDDVYNGLRLGHDMLK